MIYLNAGNLWTKSYLDDVIRLNSQHDDIKVKTLFGSIANLTPTARSFDRLPYLKWQEIDHFIDRARIHNINIRYTLNASCIGSLQDFKFTWWNRSLREDIYELHNIGVNEWTVTSPLLIECLREMFPDDFIEVSTIAEVATPEDAVRWYALGANGVNVSTSINRNAYVLGRMVDAPLTVSILANEACLWKCPWRRECYNLSSHNSERSILLWGNYPFSRCNAQRMKNPEEWIKARMVLPSWLDYYHDTLGVQWFKIAYRTHPLEVALPILRFYMDKTDPESLLGLWPTIARLAFSKEPQDMTNISCKKLEEHKMLDVLVKNMDSDHCETYKCGTGCTLCSWLYQKAKV